MSDTPGPRPLPSLDLDSLAVGFAHIPPECGESLAQAGMVCLEGQGHAAGVRLRVEGSFSAAFEVYWSKSVTEPMRRYWNDPAVATEEGAYGLAILLVRSLTGLTIIERARKGTGFDWWLGDDDNLFQGKARLEVSGILRGGARRINSRVAEKLAQTEQSAGSGLTVYIAVVEFGTPRAKVVRR
jgi:hypothetical protein